MRRFVSGLPMTCVLALSFSCKERLAMSLEPGPIAPAEATLGDDEAEDTNGWQFMGCRPDVEACAKSCDDHRSNAEVDVARCDPYSPDDFDGGLACYCQMTDAGKLTKDESAKLVPELVTSSGDWSHIGCVHTKTECESSCGVGRAFGEDDLVKCARSAGGGEAAGPIACYCHRK